MPSINTYRRYSVNKNHPLNRSRVAWWLTLPGLDGGSSLYDLMGLYPAALTNMTTSSSGWRSTTRPGGWGHLLFDGSNDFCLGPSFGFDYNSLTIGFWAFPNSIAARITPIDLGVNTTGVPSIELGPGSGSGRVAMIIPGSFQIETVNGTIAASNWYRILITKSGSATHSIYVNGVAASLASNVPFTATSTAAAKQIGRRGTNTQFFNGPLDDISIWSRPLSAAEARADYDLSCAGYPGVLSNNKKKLFLSRIAQRSQTKSINVQLTGQLSNTSSFNKISTIYSSIINSCQSNILATSIGRISVSFTSNGVLICDLNSNITSHYIRTYTDTRYLRDILGLSTYFSR